MTRDGWADKAACRGVPSSVFFPEIPSGDCRDIWWRQARAYCAVCPVRAECLAFCLPFEKQAGRRDGMWGGLTPAERSALDTGNRVRVRTR
jgi:WhiB family redox-sensing transcriptional regulator